MGHRFVNKVLYAVTQVKIPGIDVNISQVDLNLDVTELNSLRHKLLLPDEFSAKNCKQFSEHVTFFI